MGKAIVVVTPKSQSSHPIFRRITEGQSRRDDLSVATAMRCEFSLAGQSRRDDLSVATPMRVNSGFRGAIP